MILASTTTFVQVHSTYNAWFTNTFTIETALYCICPLLYYNECLRISCCNLEYFKRNSPDMAGPLKKPTNDHIIVFKNSVLKSVVPWECGTLHQKDGEKNKWIQQIKLHISERACSTHFSGSKCKDELEPEMVMYKLPSPRSWTALTPTSLLMQFPRVKLHHCQNQLFKISSKLKHRSPNFSLNTMTAAHALFSHCNMRSRISYPEVKSAEKDGNPCLWRWIPGSYYKLPFLASHLETMMKIVGEELDM